MMIAHKSFAVINVALAEVPTWAWCIFSSTNFMRDAHPCIQNVHINAFTSIYQTFLIRKLHNLQMIRVSHPQGELQILDLLIQAPFFDHSCSPIEHSVDNCFPSCQ